MIAELKLKRNSVGIFDSEINFAQLEFQPEKSSQHVHDASKPARTYGRQEDR